MSLLFLCTDKFDKFHVTNFLWITLFFKFIYAQVYPEVGTHCFRHRFSSGQKKARNNPGFFCRVKTLGYLALANLSLASAISAVMGAMSGELAGNTVSAVCQCPIAMAYLPAW